MSAFFEILKTFQVTMIKSYCFQLRKCYFRVLAEKYKQSILSKDAGHAVWTANSVKYENVISGSIKCNTSDLELWKGKTKFKKQGVHFSLFI